MKIQDVRMLPDSVREDLVAEMYGEICDRVSTDHLSPEMRASWRESAKSAIELIAHCMPDYLSEAKINKYRVVRG
jgi:hypothetical protein